MCSNSKRQFMKMVVSLLELLVKQMSPWSMYLYVQMVERRPVCILDCLCPGSVEQLWHHGAWLCHSHQKWIPKDGRDEAWNEQENESLQENDQTICTYRPLLSMPMGVYNVSLSIETKLYQKWVMISSTLFTAMLGIRGGAVVRLELQSLYSCNF